MTGFEGNIKSVSQYGFQLVGQDMWYNHDGDEDIVSRLSLFKRGDRIVGTAEPKGKNMKITFIEDKTQMCKNVIEEKVVEEQPTTKKEEEKSTLSTKSTTETESDFVLIKGKRHYLYKALLRMAREKGLKSLKVIDVEFDFEKKCAFCHSQAEYKDGVIYEALGSSTQENTGSMTREHYIEMANTRSLSRCLRFSLGIGEAAFEELNE